MLNAKPKLEYRALCAVVKPFGLFRLQSFTDLLFVDVLDAAAVALADHRPICQCNIGHMQVQNRSVRRYNNNYSLIINSSSVAST